jgi:hypothetical protein
MQCLKPTKSARLAQLVERFIYTEDVGSSSLSARTMKDTAGFCRWYFLFKPETRRAFEVDSTNGRIYPKGVLKL